MGVDLSVYRARIGLFGCRRKSTTYTVNRGSRLFDPLICLARYVGPRPSSLLLFCLACILMQSGDVELNPGPVSAESAKLDAIMQSLDLLTKSTHEYQTDNTLRLNRIEAGVSQIRQRVDSLEGRVTELSKATEGIPSLKSDLEFVKAELGPVAEQQKLVEELTATVDDLNNRLRRNNIIIKGIAEESTEIPEQLETTVRTFLSDNLNVTPGVFERIHRLGQKRQDFHRPIIIKLLDFRDKMAIFRNAPKLKNLNIKVWIENDYSPKIRLARGKLWEYGSTFRADRMRTRLVHDKLYVGDKVFVYDVQSESVIEKHCVSGTRP